MLKECERGVSVIVSRHVGALEWLAKRLGGKFLAEDKVIVRDEERIPVYESVKDDDVRGKIVFGNLPMHLACVAREVWAIEFNGAPPRGQEYGVEEMEKAGARLTPYVVFDKTW